MTVNLTPVIHNATSGATQRGSKYFYGTYGKAKNTICRSCAERYYPGYQFDFRSDRGDAKGYVCSQSSTLPPTVQPNVDQKALLLRRLRQDPKVTYCRSCRIRDLSNLVANNSITPSFA